MCFDCMCFDFMCFDCLVLQNSEPGTLTLLVFQTSGSLSLEFTRAERALTRLGWDFAREAPA